MPLTTLPSPLTADWLAREGHPAIEVEAFREEWPGGAEPSPAVIRMMARIGISMDVFALTVLSSMQFRMYRRKTEGAAQAFERAAAALRDHPGRPGTRESLAEVRRALARTQAEAIAAILWPPPKPAEPLRPGEPEPEGARPKLEDAARRYEASRAAMAKAAPEAFAQARRENEAAGGVLTGMLRELGRPVIVGGIRYEAGKKWGELFRLDQRKKAKV